MYHAYFMHRFCGGNATVEMHAGMHFHCLRGGRTPISRQLSREMGLVCAVNCLLLFELHKMEGLFLIGAVQKAGNINMQKKRLHYAFIYATINSTNPERRSPTPHVGGKHDEEEFLEKDADDGSGCLSVCVLCDARLCLHRFLCRRRCNGKRKLLFRPIRGYR